MAVAPSTAAKTAAAITKMASTLSQTINKIFRFDSALNSWLGGRRPAYCAWNRSAARKKAAQETEKDDPRRTASTTGQDLCHPPRQGTA
jgi:hypothetical protein